MDIRHGALILIAAGQGACHRMGMVRIMFVAIAAIGAMVAPVSLDAKSLRDLPKRVAKRCSTPIEWISVSGKDEVHLQPPPDADYAKVDCILKELQAKNALKAGFVGNEADPNRPLNPGWSYIAGGRITTLTALSNEARKAGWIVGLLARADDGTGYLTFRTPEGMTEAQATPFANRLWEQELGDITFGQAPSRKGSEFEGE